MFCWTKGNQSVICSSTRTCLKHRFQHWEQTTKSCSPGFLPFWTCSTGVRLQEHGVGSASLLKWRSCSVLRLFLLRNLWILIFHQENKCSHDGTVPIEEHHVPVQEQYKQPSYCRLSETSCFAESCVSKGVGRAHVVTGSITGVGVRCYMFP